MRNTSWVGGLALVIVLLLLVGAAILLTRKKQKGNYDERQQLARGKAYTIGYWVMKVYYCVYTLMLIRVQDKQLLTSMPVSILGILLGLLVFVTTCIMKDAYLGMKDKYPQSLGIIAGIGLLNIGIGLKELNSGGVFVDGELNWSFANLECAVVCAIIIVVLFIKRAIDKKED